MANLKPHKLLSSLVLELTLLFIKKKYITSSNFKIYYKKFEFTKLLIHSKCFFLCYCIIQQDDLTP